MKTLLLGGQGYVGSALATYLTARSVEFDVVDLGWRGIAHTPNLYLAHQRLTREELSKYGAVVLLAGHSSVPSCDRDPTESFSNNVLGFVELVHKLTTQKLIYASSISVYINTKGKVSREGTLFRDPVSAYDFHKQTIEKYAAFAYPNSYGLRFGTVCGPSPNIREELLLNSMVKSAITKKEISVANREIHRPLLGINDLCRAVSTILEGDVTPGVYNLASLNTTIGELADKVAKHFNVPQRVVESASKYDIQVDTSKFHQASERMRFTDTIGTLIVGLSDFYSERDVK